MWLAASAAVQAPAQSPSQSAAPPAIVRGDLLELEAAEGAGQFSIRTSAHRVFRFTFDSKTYFERESRPCAVAKLQKGDLLEIVSDQSAPAGLSYARTVHVVDRETPRRTAEMSQGRYRAYRGSADRVMPQGDLTVSGVVARVNAGRLVIRTRRDGDRAVLLREDTRYLAGGVEVSAATLKAGTRVFVRGGKNFENDVEAYQVIWGEILEPGQ